MRIYIPALSDELTAENPTNRRGWVARIPAGTHPEQAEVYEDDAVTEAALDGLSLLRDDEASAGVKRAMRRLVLAVELPESRVQAISDEPADEEGILFPVGVGSLSWEDVAALMIDDADAEPAVGAVLRAQDQESADQAIAELWDYAIGWFDIAEREALAKALNS